jgi:CO/xanthine dehydrogenase FAD-binding subunit
VSYLIASSLEEALVSLKESSGRARVVAGATDLFLQELPAIFIDLSRLPELTRIDCRDGIFSVGAAVTHTEAAGDVRVKENAAALSEASSLIGSPQVRNIATVGGNVVNAAPAADAAVALVALGARAVLIDLEGKMREEAVENLYAGYNRSLIDSSSEILIRLLFDQCALGEGSAFIRFAARNSLSLPMVNAAARVKVSKGRLEKVRLVAAPVKPAPTRLQNAEAMLTGKKAGEIKWSEIEAAAAADAEVRGSLLRCSEQYRRHLVGVLSARVVKKAVERAMNGEVIPGE